MQDESSPEAAPEEPMEASSEVKEEQPTPEGEEGKPGIRNSVRCCQLPFENTVFDTKSKTAEDGVHSNNQIVHSGFELHLHYLK